MRPNIYVVFLLRSFAAPFCAKFKFKIKVYKALMNLCGWSGAHKVSNSKVINICYELRLHGRNYIKVRPLLVRHLYVTVYNWKTFVYEV